MTALALAHEWLTGKAAKYREESREINSVGLHRKWLGLSKIFDELVQLTNSTATLNLSQQAIILDEINSILNSQDFFGNIVAARNRRRKIALATFINSCKN